MQPFTTLTGIAAPLPLANVDTDMIIPARFLKTIARTGLGKSAFANMRYAPDGSEKPDFVLNQEPYRKAEILIAFENFGCGSSREHAPWALLDFGIRCVIAPDFAEFVVEADALRAAGRRKSGQAARSPARSTSARHCACWTPRCRPPAASTARASGRWCCRWRAPSSRAVTCSCRPAPAQASPWPT